VTCIGTAWALQGLLAAPWFSDVEGLDRPVLLQHPLVMAIALSAGALLWGVAIDWLGRRGVGPRALLGFCRHDVHRHATGVDLSPAASILCPLDRGGAAVDAGTVVSYATLAEHFSMDVGSRANAALNLFHIGGAFVVQFMTDLIVQLWTPTNGHCPEVAYKAAAAFNVGLQIAAMSWVPAQHASPRKLLNRFGTVANSFGSNKASLADSKVHAARRCSGVSY
jgi:MFS family permease